MIVCVREALRSCCYLYACVSVRKWVEATVTATLQRSSGCIKTIAARRLHARISQMYTNPFLLQACPAQADMTFYSLAVSASNLDGHGAKTQRDGNAALSIWA